MARNEPHDAPEMARFSEVNAMKFQFLAQMPSSDCNAARHHTAHRSPQRYALGAVALLVATLSCTSAHAVDGCTVLLCLAAPSWRAIEQCVPPVRQVLLDLALGRPFPTCAMAGTGNAASHAWSAAPDFCPPQYTRMYDAPHGAVYSCDYAGAISVQVNGVPFARTWWAMGGDAVTDFSPAAKTQLGTWDKRFDEEFAAWLANQPSGAPQN